MPPLAGSLGCKCHGDNAVLAIVALLYNRLFSSAMTSVTFRKLVVLSKDNGRSRPGLPVARVFVRTLCWLWVDLAAAGMWLSVPLNSACGCCGTGGKCWMRKGSWGLRAAGVHQHPNARVGTWAMVAVVPLRRHACI